MSAIWNKSISSVKEDVDNVRFYLLCASCKARIEFLGRGKPPSEEPSVYVL